MSEFITRVGEFLSADTTWSGPASIPARLWEHTWLSITPVLIAGVLVIPPAVWLAHRRQGTVLATTIVNIGRAVPSFGLLVITVVLLIDVFGLRSWLAFPALVALAAPPMFTNTVAGVLIVPPEVTEAARGMGLTEGQVLGKVELPLALPVITEGVRVALVQVIATATLAALVAGGGLGRFIVDGFAKRRGEGELFVGALLVALLAVVAEVGFTRIERAVTPRGTREG